MQDVRSAVFEYKRKLQKKNNNKKQQQQQKKTRKKKKTEKKNKKKKQKKTKKHKLIIRIKYGETKITARDKPLTHWQPAF